MSVVCVSLFIDKKGIQMDKMCVYCEGVFTGDTIVCPNCNELDGLLPLEKAIDYLSLDPSDYR
jgi:hypothetical protein